MEVSRLEIGSNVQSTTTDLTLNGSANVATDGSLIFFIDSDDDDTTRKFSFKKDAAFGAGTDLFIINESGDVEIVSGNLDVPDDFYINPDTADDYEMYIGDTSTSTQYGNLWIKGSNDGGFGLRVYPRDETGTFTKYTHIGYNVNTDEAWIGTASDKNSLAIDTSGNVDITGGNLTVSGSTSPLNIYFGDKTDTDQITNLWVKGSLNGISAGIRVYPRDEAGSPVTYATFGYDANNDETVIGNASDPDSIRIDTSGFVGIGVTDPDTILDVDGAITFRELSADPSNPDEGSSALWMSDGTGSGNDGDILVKTTAGGTTQTKTLASIGTTVREIRTLSDFSPSAGIITLTSGHYQIKDTIDIGTNRFVFADDATVLFEFDDSFNNWIEHDGDSMTLFSGTATVRFQGGRGNAFILNGDNVEFIDIVGSVGCNFGFIGFYGTGTRTLGTIKGRVINQTATAGLLLNDSVFDGWTDGWTVINASETGIRNVSATADSTATGSFLSVEGLSESVIAQGSYIDIPAAASAFDIKPNVTANTSISRFFLTNAGDFFEPSTKTGSFTAVADASIGATNITAASDAGDGTVRFTFAAGPTVYVGQEVVVSGFTVNTDYNGTWYISATNGTSTFDIDAVLYGSTETGSFLSNSVTLTETTTTAANGDIILVDTDLSTDYDVGSYVYNKQTNSFQINATWAATETGDWSNASLDHCSKYLTVKYCGDQQDSVSKAMMHVLNNTDTISATSGNWVDLDLGTVTESPSSSRFKIIDAEKGLWEYIGITPLCGTWYATISAFKSGGTQVDHQFRIYKSSGTPAFEEVILESALDDNMLNLAFIAPFQVEPGDQFKMQIKAIGTSTTVTVDSLIASGE
jgi:hypothetical protein